MFVYAFVYVCSFLKYMETIRKCLNCIVLRKWTIIHNNNYTEMLTFT